MRKQNMKCEDWFKNTEGNVLVTGNMYRWKEIILKIFQTYSSKTDMPTILLSGNIDTITNLSGNVYGPQNRSFHPTYEMSRTQICKLLQMKIKDLNYTDSMDTVIEFALAVMEVAKKCYLLSIPAMRRLLYSSDDYIADLGEKKGVPRTVTDVIRHNILDGMLLRLIIMEIDRAFSNIAVPGVDSYCNFRSAMKPIAFYQVSVSQNIMNAFLKEELNNLLKVEKKIRVIAEELSFVGEEDELLTFLLEMKHLGKVELVVVSYDVASMLRNKDLDFDNVALFWMEEEKYQHLSERIFDEYVDPNDVAGFLGNWNYIPYKVAIKTKGQQGVILTDDDYFVKGR